jgi:Predicted TIM-barrel enzyme, possibly a dioxygenase
MRYTKDEIIARLNKTLAEGKPILTSGAGTGISAKFTEKGGADLIVVYNSGRYRMSGYSSWAGLLPIGDANAIVMQMGEREILPIVKDTPVLAGVFASDPTRDISYFLQQVKNAGFSGVINFPTIGVLEGQFRDNLESTGIGYQREVDMIKLANEMGMFTMAYVFDPEQAASMAEVGIDAIVAHMGNTTGGTVGQENVIALDKSVEKISEISAAARKIKQNVYVLCHGGPIALPEDVAYVYERTDVDGFVGASSVERLPVEKPLEEATRAFKSLKLSKHK